MANECMQKIHNTNSGFDIVRGLLDRLVYNEIGFTLKSKQYVELKVNCTATLTKILLN